ncbi:germination protein, Ger(x)C family [Paenibacillus vortex V453]|uniref:Germination protein, Ger(X)C family n=1 Tax=Paenibacillus vortex V453 TaxID=715225 RepID=A0A2R9T209_9BACL|nr:Ger(x)C family spore germination protein [Paenibacillus vortex]EFU43601.1 germination protein, Ger(x)C family [Paenibacillus vortex V453]
MNMLKRRLVWVLCCSMLTLTLSGCEFRDIDLRLFVVSIGVDVSEKSPDLYNFSFKISIPSGDPKTGEEKSLLITEESDSIAEAIRQVKSKVDKELDFGHCKGVMYGEAYARRDISKIEDWTVRRRDMQLLMYPAVAIPTAEEVLRAEPPTERIAGNAIFLALSEDGTESPFITRTYSFDLARRMTEVGEDPVMPVVEVGEKNVLNINKVALMDKSKVKVILTKDETRLFNLLDLRNLSTNFGTRVDGELIEVNTDRTRASYKIVTSPKGQEAIHFRVRIQATLEEKEDIKLLTPEEVKKIEGIYNKELSKAITDVLEKIRKTGRDPLGFGLRYGGTHWNNKTEMEEWAAIYPHIKFNVTVKLRIKSTGYKQ